jgi:hypothetical protein
MKSNLPVADEPKARRMEQPRQQVMKMTRTFEPLGKSALRVLDSGAKTKAKNMKSTRTMKRILPPTTQTALPPLGRARTIPACAAAVLLALTSLPQPGFAQSPAAGDQQIQLLFVQNGTGIVFDPAKGTLRLKNVTPSTLFFSDRPVRLAGHLHTKDEFLPMWGQTADSFVKDPPNATVSTVEPGKPDLANFVVKLQKPRLDGNDLIYTVTVIEGAPPKTGGATAIFIDILGFWRRNIARVAVVESVAASASASQAAAGAANQAHAAAAQANAAAAQANAAAAQAKAATPSAPPPPAAAPPAPAKPTPYSPEQKLAELKSMLNQGFITQAQYNQASQKILNQLIQ